MKKTNDGVIATIDRFENGLAVLELDHNQTLTVAKRNLPKGVKEGDVLEVEFLTNELATKRKANLAKAMLEEILKGE